MTNDNVIRLLLVDDHPVVRDGLRSLEDLDARVKIVGTAGTCAEALESMHDFLPDVVLLDVMLPDSSGLEVCRQIRKEHPQTRILFLSFFNENHLVLNAMKAGADGYLLKSLDTKEILKAIHKVMEGGSVFHPLIAEPSKNGASAKIEKDVINRLTGQEKRVLALIAEGKSSKETADILNLSPKTVRNYLDMVYQKLQVNNRTQAALLFSRSQDQTR